MFGNISTTMNSAVQKHAVPSGVVLCQPPRSHRLSVQLMARIVPKLWANLVLAPLDGKPGPGSGAHPELARNFYDVVRSRKTAELLTPVQRGCTAASLCHLGNVAYRLGRSIEFDNSTFSCGDDAEANSLLTETYREPFVMSENV